MKLEIAFGEVLRKFRNDKNLTQEKLAFESNLDRTYISLLERGRRQPSLASILQLANALDIPPEQFITNVVNLMNQSNK